MQTMTIATAALVALSGLALAAGTDESAFTIDLTGASKDVHTYHIKCQYGGKDLSSCGTPSIWENTNDVVGLQTKKSVTGVPADDRVIS